VAGTVIVHMAASLDGFIARRDGSVDWLETSDEFPDGATLEPEYIHEFLKSIDCYVMGARTYETALRFEADGKGWAYGDTPTVVLTSRSLPRTRENIEFYAGDVADLVTSRLRPRYRKIWVAGGAHVAGDLVRLGLADEISYAILPIVIGDGIRFFEGLDRDVPLHVADVKAYRHGMVELRYECRHPKRASD